MSQVQKMSEKMQNGTDESNQKLESMVTRLQTLIKDIPKKNGDKPLNQRDKNSRRI